jgi:DNA mismatch repair protein MutS
MATQSFCYLLNFIQEHNPDLVRKIDIPLFNNSSERMILANHTLLQLNIIDDGSVTGQYSSVLSFLNKCCSSIGKRKFQYQLTNPTFDEEWLNNEYNMISVLLEPDNYIIVDASRRSLTKIRDIEKICRQIVLKKIYPSSIAHLYRTIDYINQMNTCLYELPEVCNYLCSEFFVEYNNIKPYQYIENICLEIRDFLDKRLNIDNCQRLSSMMSFDLNIIQPGVSDKLDKANNEYKNCNDTFLVIRNYLNELMQKSEKSPDVDFVKIHETEKSGVCLQITSKRSKILQGLLDSIISKNTNRGKITTDNNIVIELGDLKFKNISSSSQNVDVESSQLNQISKRLLQLKDTINNLISETYLNILSEIETNWIDELEKITKYVAKLDVLQCKTYLTKQYNYCRPQIDSSAESSYLDSRDLRHCLI